MATQTWRHLWRNAPNGANFNFNWPIINRHSVVVITAAEARLLGRPNFKGPDRFIGAAGRMHVTNIAPHDNAGGVEFKIHWDGNFPHLNVWTDITVFDPKDFVGQN
jgi:hypothetical protein